MIFKASLAAALMATCAAAHAELTAPVYRVGEAFIYDNGRVERVEAVEGARITWSARSGRPYVRAANPIVPILEWSYRGQLGARRVQGDPDRIFPLRAGARVQFRTVNEARAEDAPRRVRRSVHLWTCAVRAPERVSTPAGAFQAYPIACDRFSPGNMRVLERITWHYAPDVGHYVRREARNMRNGETETIRLYAQVPPRESNVVRLEALARKAQRQQS